MIKDEILRKASAEAADAILESLPEEYVVGHTFSRNFQKKMKKLIRREKHPVIYYGIRSVACALGIIILCGVLLISVSEEARASVFGWFKQLKGETYYRYHFEGEKPEEVPDVQYEPSWVPEGYTLLNKDVISGDGILIYIDQQGYIAQLAYIKTPTEGDVSLLVDGQDTIYVQSEVMVGDYRADMYVTTESGCTSSLIWYDKYNTLFYISAMLDEEELIKWAESIVEVEKE